MRDTSANRYDRRILNRVLSVPDYASPRMHRELTSTRSVVIPARSVPPSFIDPPIPAAGSSHQRRVNYPLTDIVGYRTLRRRR